MSDSNNNGRTDTADWLRPKVESEGLSRYLETLRERSKLILGCVAVTTGIAILYVLTASKVYEAQADLFIAPVSGDNPALVGLPLLAQSSDPAREVETASRLVENLDVAERVATDLGEKDPSGLLAGVTAEPVAQSSIVTITAQASTPDEARDLANSFAREAVAEQTDELHKQIDATIPVLQARIRAGGPENTANPDSPQAALEQLEVLRSGPNPTMRVETTARTPGAAVSPRVTLSIVGGLFAGLVLGICAAFAIQVLDPRLRREEQLRRLYSLPILARIPKEKGRSPKPLHPLSLSPATAEAYRTLRATLATSRRGSSESGHAIMVTGSSLSEGKTTSAINLSSTLAAAGHTVILIEADLRRPAIGAALDVKPAHGVVSTLIESVSLTEALVSIKAFGPGLGLLLADYEGTWISELFTLPSAIQLIEEAKTLADFVIVDSPPLTEVSDTLPLAGYVDDILVIARIGRTNLARLEELGELLASNDLRPLGFILVGAPATGSGYYYGVDTNQRRELFTNRPRLGQSTPPANTGRLERVPRSDPAPETD